MLPVCVHSRSGVPPGRVDDLTGDLGAVLDKESLITAGQAMSWQSTFTCGAVTAVPLTPASAMIFKTPGRRTRSAGTTGSPGARPPDGR